LTLEAYDAKLAEQGQGCAICGSTDPGASRVSFVVDHDHGHCPPPLTLSHPGCGQCVRGLLCNPCNRALGVFEKRDALEAMASYLQRNRRRLLEDMWAAEHGDDKTD
jgi:Recombination endonuclease VII